MVELVFFIFQIVEFYKIVNYRKSVNYHIINYSFRKLANFPNQKFFEFF